LEYTPAQLHIIQAARSCQHRVISIEALAGTGKTSTLEAVARALPDSSRILYLSFNKDAADDARTRMPGNVKSMTAHGLAYRLHGHHIRERLSGYIRSAAISAALPRRSVGRNLYNREVSNILRRFCYSADAEIGPQHLPDRAGPDTDIAEELHNALEQFGTRDARTLWQHICDPDGDFPVTHDAYLKQFALSRQAERLGFDLVMLDECQDSNPATIEIVRQIPGRKILVGDANQAIYGWRGAKNAFDGFDPDFRGMLNRSFRFGPAIAGLASRILRDELGYPHALEGNPEVQTRVFSHAGKNRRYDALLFRTNEALMATMMEILVRNPEANLKVAGKSTDMLDRLHDLEALKAGRKASRSSELSLFESYRQAEDYAETDEGGHLVPLMNAIESHGMPALKNALERVQANQQRPGGLVLSTAHRAKGLEFGSVAIASDFRKVFGKDDQRHRTDEEHRLRYVACTRAIQSLDVSRSDYFLDQMDSLTKEKAHPQLRRSGASVTTTSNTTANQIARIKARQQANLAAGLPRNHGLKWTDDQRQHLKKRWLEAPTPETIASLAKSQARKPSSIVSELEKQQLLSREQAIRLCQ
jgi:superfamily I DNA/RNA helicase